MTSNLYRDQKEFILFLIHPLILEDELIFNLFEIDFQKNFVIYKDN